MIFGAATVALLAVAADKLGELYFWKAAAAATAFGFFSVFLRRLWRGRRQRALKKSSAARARSTHHTTTNAQSDATCEECESGGEAQAALPSGYICWMHRGQLVQGDRETWQRAVELHLHTKRRIVEHIETGPESDLVVVAYDSVPTHCDHLHTRNSECEYVCKRIARDTESRLREFATLRRLSEPQHYAKNARYFSLPIEMWLEDTSSRVPAQYCMLSECKPLDLYDYMGPRRPNRRPTPYPVVGHIVAHLLRALEILHDQYGIAHNDIKPENVLIDPVRQQCWLCDFGGAVMIDSGQTDYFIQTLLYASPERHQQIKCDTSTDIWSLGILAAEFRRGSDLSSLVDDDRWLSLLRQPQKMVQHGKMLHRVECDEWLDEPGVVEALCVEDKTDLSEQFYAFLRRSVRHYPADRYSAAQLLRCNECVRLWK